ncbi:FAD-binding oxidoreductase [Paraburkholderia nemoris]|uniref:FAD-binding oxidoreductase n=1 Tax=Paraburkholderia nemoris TaxID=2793076 RepID=UPI0038B94F00
MNHETLIESLVGIVGRPYVIEQTEDMASLLIDVRRRYRGEALCVVNPASTDEVSRIVRLCYQNEVPITPVGGNTGLVGGACARTTEPGILLGLSRMNRIRKLSTVDDTISVDAGCVLADIQAAALEAGRLFPLSLTAEGSCQIGGNISTNAGGVCAVRYGTMRQLVLGLEVVLPNGHIIDGMLHLRKDNTGYDLKHLFIGAEGTLGIVTGAVLKLFPAPCKTATAMLALDSVDDALKVFSLLRQRFSERVTSFEILNDSYVKLICERMESVRSPFASMPAWQLLVEVTDSDDQADLQTPFENVLAEALEAGYASDAIIAQSEAQTHALWDLRHGVSESIRFAPNMSHDSSVPLDAQPAYATLVEERITAAFPDASVLMVGHLGDGNMHVVVLFQPGYFADDDAFLATSRALDTLIDDVVVSLNGSITAEHGIGLSYLKRLAKTADPQELMLMRQIKQVFDPKAIMNPGKLFEPLK